MTEPVSDPDEAMTQEELERGEPAGPSGTSAKPPRDAFAELLAPKAKQTPKPKQPLSWIKNPSAGRFGLGAYLDEPASYPSSRVIFHNDDFVAIHDLFPKATVHTLLLPRSKDHNLLHPYDAFEDAAFLAGVRHEAARLRDLVAQELQRRHGRESVKDKRRQAVLDGEEEVREGEEVDEMGLPRGRDWKAEVMVGVHAVPSMAHLHVHVLSRDMRSEKVQHRKHYNSFTTPFLVPLEDFPLDESDPRRDTKRQGYLAREFHCWRCGMRCASFVELKGHLEKEFVAWKKE